MALAAFNLKRWIDENRHLLKPPVGNKMVWQDTEFQVMIVGGPNARKDYHIEDGEELFFQIEGDIFLLPPHVPHSPQRPAGTVGMVVERMRAPKEIDHLTWFCENCGALLYDATLHCKDLGTQLKPIIEAFFADEVKRTCRTCGKVMQKPEPPKAV